MAIAAQTTSARNGSNSRLQKNLTQRNDSLLRRQSVGETYEFTFPGNVTRLGGEDRNYTAPRRRCGATIWSYDPRLRRMHVCTNAKSTIYISPPAHNTGIHTHGRPHLGPGHWRHHRNLLARRGRPAAPTSVPGRRPACFVGRSPGRPARHVRQGSRNRNVHTCDGGVFLFGRLYHDIV